MTQQLKLLPGWEVPKGASRSCCLDLRTGLIQWLCIYRRAKSQFLTKMVYYTNCCFCIKSKTGAKVLAILGIVLTALSILSSTVLYGVYYDELHSPRIAYGSNWFLKFIDAIYGVSIVINLIWILFCVLLIYGINKNKKDFLLPWMIFEMIGLVVRFVRLTQLNF